jgi:hypothetical protein
VSQQAAEIRSRLYKQQNQHKNKYNKRPADNANKSGNAGNKTARTDSAAIAAEDSRQLFLYPRDSDLLGIPSSSRGDF